ncbi:tetratricopeptide repeat protein [soil metagenome]
MKKIVVILFVAIPVMVFSQVKPSIPKAEKALRENKIDEAKTIIDATTGSQEFMVDKKGQPTKNAAKAWYMKGLVYAAIDTSTNAKFNALDANAFASAKEAFEKAKEIDPKAAYFITDPVSQIPMLTENVNIYIAQKVFNKAYIEYKDKKNFKKAFELTEQTLYYIPNDTSILKNGGLYFGWSAEEWEKSIDLLNRYVDKGGKDPDAYLQRVIIYRDKLKNNEKALEMVKDGETRLPNNPDLPKYELDLYVKMNRLPDAKAAMEKQIKADPTNKESWYYLGVINSELKDFPSARKAYEEASKLDGQYFDAAFGVADIVYLDAKEVKKQMNQLGITAEDKKKRFELDKIYVEKLKVALPYWEKAEKLSPDDGKVLDNLMAIYQDLDNQPQVARITKHMKTLGLLD